MSFVTTYIKDVMHFDYNELDYSKAFNWFSGKNTPVEDLILQEMYNKGEISKEVLDTFWDICRFDLTYSQWEQELSKKDLKTQYLKVLLRLSKESLIVFIKLIQEDNGFSDYKLESIGKKGVYFAYWFHIVLANEFSHTLRAQIYPGSEPVRKIVISIVSQHAKSLFSVTYTVLLIANLPNKNAIYCSYSDRFSEDILSRDIEPILSSSKFHKLFSKTFASGLPGELKSMLLQSGVKIPIDNSNTKNTFQKGSIRCRSLTSITGIRADGGIIVDDPIKNADEIRSETFMKALKENIDSSVLTRVNDRSSVIFLQTRWSGSPPDAIQILLDKDKAMKRLQEKEGLEQVGLNLTEIVFRAFYDTSDNFPYDFRIKQDDILWDLHKTKCLIARESDAPHLFQALYQQRPMDGSGVIFKEDMFTNTYSKDYYPHIFERPGQIVIGVDTSYNDNSNADKACIVVMYISNELGIQEYYLLDYIYRRMGFNETLEELENIISLYPSYTNIIIEAKANGQAVIDSLELKYNGVVGVSPNESKWSRASAVSHIISQGRLILPEGHRSYEVIDQFTKFDGKRGARDDIVDTIVHILRHYDTAFTGSGSGLIRIPQRDPFSPKSYENKNNVYRISNNKTMNNLFSKYGLNHLR